MTTIQDRIIKDFRDKFNQMDKFGVIYSKDNSIPILENSSNQLEVIEQFLIQSIKEVEEETRKEVVENIKDYAVNNTIAYGDGNVIKWWPNGLWKDIERLSITNKEKEK